MTLSLNASNAAALTSGSSVSTSVTTTAANCVLVAIAWSVADATQGVPNGTSSVTGTSSFTNRSKKTSTGTSSIVGGQFWIDIETWYGLAATAGTYNVTAAFARSMTSEPGGGVILFAVAGASNPSSPWDTDASLPGTTNAYGNSRTAVASASVSASETPDFVFSVAVDLGVSGTTAGSGETLIKNIASSSSEATVEYAISSSTGAQTVNWSGTQFGWMTVTDAIAGGSAPITGPIATHLTKPSMSASGTVTAVKGTVTTALTKPSQSLAGTLTQKGTIATNLTKASMSASGTETFPGTITSRLTKASFNISGYMEPVGTITTNLSKASQSLVGSMRIVQGTIATNLSQGISQSSSGWTTVKGSMVTALRGISQISSEDLEIFTGTITTSLDPTGVNIVARAFELFTGTITTRLGPVNMSLAAQEDFVGTILTKLGNESGQMAATVVNAEEIIEGPIVMQLGPFRPLILGAQLGTPGQGKWFSYRYMDS